MIASADYPTNAASINLNVVPSAGQTLDMFTEDVFEESMISGMQAMYGEDLTLEVTSFEAFELDGRQAIDADYTVTISGVSLDMNMQQYADGDNFITVTATANPGEYVTEFDALQSSTAFAQ